MTSASLFRFRTSAIGSFRELWPAAVKVSGRTYPAAANLGPILMEIPGEGAIERRGLTACVLKTDMPVEPAIGTVLVHDDREYTVNSTSGRGPTTPAWRIICVEKDRN